MILGDRKPPPNFSIHAFLPPVSARGAFPSSEQRRRNDGISKLHQLPLLQRVRGIPFNQAQAGRASKPEYQLTHSRLKAASLSTRYKAGQESARVQPSQPKIFARIEEVLKKRGSIPKAILSQRQSIPNQLGALHKQISQLIKSRVESLPRALGESDWRCLRVQGADLQEERTSFGAEIDKLNNLQTQNDQALSQLLFNKQYLASLQAQAKEPSQSLGGSQLY